MRTTIDQAGRVVIPKALRDRLGLTGGAEVEIHEHDGVLELRPKSREVRATEDSDGRLVLVAPEGVEPLTDEDVRHAVEQTRRWPRS